jgi:hypothetical protein
MAAAAAVQQQKQEQWKAASPRRPATTAADTATTIKGIGAVAAAAATAVELGASWHKLTQTASRQLSYRLLALMQQALALWQLCSSKRKAASSLQETG